MKFPSTQSSWPLSGLVAGLITLPLLRSGFGFADDYYFLDLAQRGELPLWNIQATLGRPLTGFLLSWGFGAVPGIDGLWMLRLIGWLGLLATGWSLGVIGRRRGLSPRVLLTVVLVLGLMPATGIYVGWAACFPYPWALALALWAGEGLWVLAHGGLPWRGLRCVALVGGVLLAFLAAANIYQIALGFAVLPALLALGGERRVPVRPLVLLGQGLVALSGLAFLGMRWVTSLAPQQDALLARGTLTLNPLSRVALLIQEAVPSSLAGWAMHFPVWMAFLGGMVCVLGIGILLGALARWRRWPELVLVVVALGFVWAPLLLIRETWFPHRMLAGTAAVFLLLAVLGWYRLQLRWVRIGWFNGALLVAYLSMGAWVLWAGFVQPNRRVVQSLRTAVQSLPARPPSLIYLDSYLVGDRLSTLRPVAEFGHGSGASDWIADRTLAVLLRERFGAGETNILRFLGTRVRDYPVRSPIIDGWAVNNVAPPESGPASGATVQHPILGPIEPLEQHWYYVPDFGVLNLQYSPWAQHEVLGWIVLVRRTPEGLEYARGLGQPVMLERAPSGSRREPSGQ